MICLKCNEFRVGFVGRLCPVCSDPLVLETNSNRDKLVFGRMREFLSRWQKSGEVSKKAISEIETALANTNIPQDSNERIYSFGILTIFIEWIQSVLTSFFIGLGAIFEPILRKPKSSRAYTKISGKDADASFENLTEGILVEDNSNLSGLDAISELDEKLLSRKGKYDISKFKVKHTEPEFEIWSGLRPLFNEYIWWFIGTILILAGSIMGIREAWTVLTGVNRHLMVLIAVIIYEFLFTALGLFLNTKSVVTGKLLTVISILLLPVSFSVVSDVFLESNSLGIIALIISTILSSGILSFIAKQFQISIVGGVLAILPSLVLLSIIPKFTESLYPGILIFLPLFIVSYCGRNFTLYKEGSKGIFLISIYGALSVLAVFLNQSFVLNSSFELGSLPLVILFIWILGMSSIFAISFGSFGIKKETSRIYIILEIFFLAVTLVIASVSGLFLFTTQTWEMNLNFVRIAYSLIPIGVTILFFNAINRHEMSFHLFMFLSIASSYLFIKEILPSTFWSIALAPFIPISSMLYYKDKTLSMRVSSYVWGISSGIFSCAVLFFLSSLLRLNSGSILEVLKDPVFFNQVCPILAGGFYFAFVTHRFAGYERSAIHLLASIGSFTFIFGILLLSLPFADFISRICISLGIVSALYHFASIYFERKRGDGDNSNLQPMDDISLAGGILSLLTLFFVSSSAGNMENAFFVLTGIILITRSYRDNSSFSGFIGTFLISISMFRLQINSYPAASTAINLIASSIIALAASILCILFPNLTPAEIKSRKAFWVIRLPFAAQGPVLIRNALSATAIIYIVYSFTLILFWFGIPDQPERNLVIVSGILLAIIFLLGFFTRALNSFYLRGSVVSLSLIFIFIGLAAVANRIGRPLSPIVVGQNLSLGIIALWIFSRILFWKGKSLAIWLDNSNQGRFYYFVPLIAMTLLGFVLFIDVWLLQPVNIYRFLYITPPTFFIGASLAAFFLSRSLGSIPSLQVSFGLILVSFSLIFSQQSFLGIRLTPLILPGSQWVPTETVNLTRNGDWTNPFLFLPESISAANLIIRSATGIAVGGFSFALLSVIIPLASFGLLLRKIIFRIEDYYPLQSLMGIWTLISTIILSLIAFQYAFIQPAVIAIGYSALLLLSPFPKIGNVSIALSGILLIHGFAHVEDIYPIWVGPLFGLVGLIMVISIFPVSKFSKKPYSRILESSHAGSFIYSFLGIIYAFAAFSPSRFDNAVPGLLWGFVNGISGVWMQSLSLAITLLFISISLFIGSFQWTKTLTVIAAIGSYLLLGFSGISSFPVLCRYGICNADNSILSLLFMIPYFSLIFACVAVLARAGSFLFKNAREDFSIGSGIGSDLLIILSGILLGLFIRLGVNSNLPYNEYALVISILVIILISLYTAFKEKKPRHIYFAQIAIASLYLALKPSFPNILTPEVDAISALLFGFVLVGITTISRRVGIPPIEESTRRFAALMPVVAAIALPTETSYQNAGMATFSSVLYAALSITSSNRLYAVLAAVTGNLAIFTAIKAYNMQGIEIYLAPIGLFTLFLGHIFKSNLNMQIIKIIRILGGLLLYLPAGINISFEIGQAADSMYSVYFGVICLIGVLAGMLFQIRSYLFLGLIFFTLNLAVNLLQTGLRDQRMGFILLSLTGLLIIGSLVYYSIRKDKILGFVERTRKDLSKWE
jgi:hypothetical protein